MHRIFDLQGRYFPNVCHAAHHRGRVFETIDAGEDLAKRQISLASNTPRRGIPSKEHYF